MMPTKYIIDPFCLVERFNPTSFKCFSFMIPALFTKNTFTNLQFYCCYTTKSSEFVLEISMLHLLNTFIFALHNSYEKNSTL